MSQFVWNNIDYIYRAYTFEQNLQYLSLTFIPLNLPVSMARGKMPF